MACNDSKIFSERAFDEALNAVLQEETDITFAEGLETGVWCCSSCFVGGSRQVSFISLI